MIKKCSIKHNPLGSKTHFYFQRCTQRHDFYFKFRESLSVTESIFNYKLLLYFIVYLRAVYRPGLLRVRYDMRNGRNLFRNYLTICRHLYFSLFNAVPVVLIATVTHNELTTWSRIILEKLTVAQFFKNFPDVYGIRRLITVFIRIRRCVLT